MSNTHDAPFPVVVLGGSAGSLDAFTKVLEALDAQDAAPGMAFVIVPHLSPDTESYMPELMRHATRLPVNEIEGPTRVECDHVYVLPPDKTLGIENAELVPRRRAAGAAHHPVDDVFKAAAHAFGPRAAGIVLSGTGSNGSAGIPAIREVAGLVIAQTPESAECGEMARRAIDTGFVDAVLPPAEMIEALIQHRDHLLSGGEDSSHDQEGHIAAEPGKAEKPPETDLLGILAILKTQSSLDFQHYKHGTLQRRIDRRMHLARLDTLAEYADLLKSDEAEQSALTDDLLITVTGFFRDAKAWEDLRAHVIRPAIAAHEGSGPIRAWVAGCASGEEAYTLAIELFEEAHAQDRAVSVEIFATDASPGALARARLGIYPAAAIQDLPQHYQDRYFDHDDDTVQVRADLRKAVVFAPQNLILDPPFSHLDIVICRNVLIYLQPEMQKRLVHLFHFSLTQGGHLFLGSAESLGTASHLFSTVSKQWRIYRRQGPTRHDIIDFPLGTGTSRRALALPARHDHATRSPARIAERTLKALADRYAPASILVDADLNILYYHGETEPFLRSQAGHPTQNLSVLARNGLGQRLRLLIEAAVESGNVTTEKAQLISDAERTTLELEAMPITGPDATVLVLVGFRNLTTIPRHFVDDLPPTNREKLLEDEVALLRDDIATSSITNSRAQEELKSYNEEIMSMNEELRAANEELETSKEELQSLNEELNTVNTQLRVKVGELHERTNDLSNLLSSTDVATLFLTTGLNIRWFSPQVTQLFNARQADTGRPISDLVRSFGDPGFIDACQRVLKTLSPDSLEVMNADGRWFIRRIFPYRTDQDHIEGVVVTFSDVTEIQAARKYAEKIVETAPNPFLVLDEALRVSSANPAFYNTFKVDSGQTTGRLVYDLGNGQWNIPELRDLLTEIHRDSDHFSGYEVSHHFEAVGPKVMRLSGQRVDHLNLVLLAIEDITESKQHEAHQWMLMEELNHRVKNTLSVVQALSSQTLRRADTLDEFGQIFGGRLTAIAKGHDQLINRDWKGADIALVIDDAVQGFDRDRISLKGPSFILSAQKCLALNLILHELETNAVKHGAFSGNEGRIDIGWTLTDRHAALVWQEHGGPSVAPPRANGYGSRLTRQLVEHELEGSLEMRFDPSGLRCEIAFDT